MHDRTVAILGLVGFGAMLIYGLAKRSKLLDAIGENNGGELVELPNGW